MKMQDALREIRESISKKRPARLRGADLRGADLRGADLRGADLRGADLSGANLYDAYLSGAKLYETNLRGANLGGAKLHRANLEGANLESANLQKSDIEFAYLSRANLRGANLRGASLKGAKIQGADLYYADLLYADLSGADLRGANLRETILIESRIICADLCRSDLTEADLRNANLYRSDLSGADLRGANLEDADLTEVDLSGAELEGAYYPTGPLPGLWKRDSNGRLTNNEIYKYPHSTYGASTAAVIKARKSVGMDPGKFKRSFPDESERIKGITRGRPLRPEVVAEVQSSVATRDDTGKPLVWIVTKGEYDGDQRVSNLDNIVAKFNVDMNMFPEQRRDVLSRLADTSRRSGHPQENDPLFTIGWVRYLNLPNVILIEEVQSDVQAARRGLMDKRALAQAGYSESDAERADRELAFFQPYADAFYYDAVGTIFEIAEVEGKPVEMLSFDQKIRFGSPRNVYEDLPRKMGMKKVGKSLFDEVSGDVWFYKPNRRRR